MATNSSTYYGPVDETSSDILLEKTFLNSGYLTGVAFGIQLMVYGACIHLLWTKQRTAQSTKFFIPYLTILCALNLVWTATSAYGLQLTFIDNRNYPGGIITFLGVEFALPANIVSLASYISSNILADALMIWRCYIVWAAAPGAKMKALLVIILPSLMLLGSFSRSSSRQKLTLPGPGLFGSITAVFATPFFALSMVLNMVVSLLIMVRIWAYRRRGELPSSYGGKSVSFAAIFVESALLYSIISMLVVVTFSIGHPINQIWLGIAPATQLIANYLIIYRIAQGRALSKETDTVSSAAASENESTEEKVSV
ncbi:hypothetical protein K435DRAFT_643875 [Dendrothele bispora CBS 962.96]|uniref:Uncharacterized protein n=1 Tax=Dendrothele bispora (strain CBS 962.96) TaxID=1314807 RepID=A0A4S8MVA8_DENBC|nr:hypothetical protein K435DRAFT_643875 [Dendrothele bispora CBS 962.96]